MSVFKAIIILDSGGNGWSETHYYDAQDLSEDDIQDDVEGLITRRRALLAPSASVLAVRLVDTEAPFSATLYGQTVGAGPGTYNAAVNSPPWLATLATLTDASRTVQRPFELRGWPDTEWKWDSTTPAAGIIGPAISPLWQRYADWLTGKPNAGQFPVGAFGMLARQQSFTLTKIAQIDTVSAATVGANWVITTAPAFEAEAGDTVQITKCRGEAISGLNSITTVITADNTTHTYTLASRRIDRNPPQITKPGYARLSLRIFRAYDQAFSLRYVKRDTGRPFGLTRGRRSVRR